MTVRNPIVMKSSKSYSGFLGELKTIQSPRAVLIPVWQ
jgi:hypothetical protein